MSELGNLLKELRGKESLRDVAKRSGISHTYLSIVEKGYDLRSGSPARPSFDTLRRLAKAYNYPYEKLLRAAGYLDEEIKEDKAEYRTPSNIMPPPQHDKDIPLVGKITAGLPIDRIENIETYIPVDSDVIGPHDAFALRVQGDSMSGNGIRDGNIVVCVKTPDITPNDVAVVAVNEEEATLKRVEKMGDTCLLIASNPNFRPQVQVHHASEIHIIGKVVEYRGKPTNEG